MKGRRRGGKNRSWRAGKKGTKKERKENWKNQRNGMRSQNFVVGTASLSSAIEKLPTELASRGLRIMSCARLPTASTIAVQWVVILALVLFHVMETWDSRDQPRLVPLFDKYSFHILYSFLLSSTPAVYPILFTSVNKKFWEELITHFPLIPHGPSPTILRRRTNAFTELLPSNDRGIHRSIYVYIHVQLFCYCCMYAMPR
jgi:hypothetical protein